MQTFLQDLRYGARTLLKSPGVSVIAVLTLALGLGANTAIFSVVNAVLLRPLPFKEPERLVMIREMKLPQFPEFAVASGNFMEWVKQNTTFERLIALRPASLNLAEPGNPELLRGLSVTSGFCAMLGVQPQLGRDFLPEEAQPGRNNVVLLSHKLWVRRFGSDPKIVNQTIPLHGQSYTVIGVMPAGFQFIDRESELWTLMAFTAQDAQNHGGHSLGRVIGQLKPGVSPEQARAELSTIETRLAAQFPSVKGWDVKMWPLLDFTVRSIKPALLVLLVAVAFVLLIACVNVANLLLARATGRQKELAIRTALGAGRARIVRQLLTESLLLALVGGTVGVLLAIWGTEFLLALAPKNLPRLSDVAIDNRALAFTTAITLLTGVVFGLAPAWQASKPNLNDVMKDAGRGSTEGGQRKWVRSTLVVLEVASALVLLIGAGLMLKSFWQLQQVDPGFQADNALALKVTLPKQKYPEEPQRVAFFQQVLEKVKALPGVQAAGATSLVPVSEDDFVLSFEVEDQPPLPNSTDPSANFFSVSADYFKAMGIPLLRGRLFNERDTSDATHVALINETLAQKIFPKQDPIGKRLTFDRRDKNPDWYEIVGVVGDVKNYGLDQATTLQIYEPFTQQTFSSMSLIVRTESDLASLASAIRREVLSLDKEQPISGVVMLTELLSTSVAQRQFAMLLLGVFAVVALLLAAIGIYGVLSYAVTQRTHEIGIRMALGAGQREILRLVVGQGMRLALLGVVIGLAAAFTLMRLLASLLFEVSATDPLTFGSIALLLVGIALVACWVPARRAAQVDPLVALRSE
jgi:putative ABC transport system permease protein